MANKKLVLSAAFKSDLKRYKHDKKVQSELKIVLDLLQSGSDLPTKYRNHQLSNNWKGHLECHIRPNVLLIYKVSDSVYLTRIGSHSELGLTESIIKLRISEDTCCVPSKTSYMNEDGYDDNGIYYFGKKPKPPINWKEYKRNDNKEMKLEGYSKPNNLSVTYIEFDSKTVTDEDGYDTDYTMYAVIELPDSAEWFDYVKHNANKGRGIPNSIISGYVFVLGDKDIYNPNDDEIAFDYECDTKSEALEWFDNYDNSALFDDEELY